jgi:hypothetical protein
MPPTGISIAMKFFGKRTMPDGKEQRLSEFKEEWDGLLVDHVPGTPVRDEHRVVQHAIIAGIEDGSFTY